MNFIHQLLKLPGLQKIEKYKEPLVTAPVLNVEANFAQLYGEIRGFFWAFEFINTKVNHQYTFTLDLFDKGENTKKTVEDYFKAEIKGGVLLEKLTDWELTLAESLDLWLFNYAVVRASGGPYLIDAGNDFNSSNETARKELIQQLLQKLKDLILPLNVWETKHYGHGRAYALEGPQHLFFLHILVED